MGTIRPWHLIVAAVVIVIVIVVVILIVVALISLTRGSRAQVVVAPVAPTVPAPAPPAPGAETFTTAPPAASYGGGMTPQLALIGVVVADMARSLAFYRALGLDVPAEADTTPHAEATLPSGLRIAWDTVETVRSFDPGWTAPTGSHHVALAFDCGSPAAVDTTYAELVAAGHDGHLPPWDAFWGQRYAVVHDPDGNAVDLFAALPVTP
ncbi:hypothetical protein AGMMS50218_15730 [Actinomycetota bacterium]|nr:hypothetical protein AGMMS50218_15730 [Actinomycetota bacterium]